MGFRFRKSVKLFPGVRINFSKSGVSTTVGPRGFKTTIGHGKVRQTVGIPGTGISHTEQHSLSSAAAPAPARSSGSWVWVVLLGVIAVLGWPDTWWFLVVAAVVVAWSFARAPSSTALDMREIAAEPIAAAPAAPAPAATRGVMLSLNLDLLREVVTYDSETEPGVARIASLQRMECSCPDFARRAEFAPLDLRRLCKHLQRALLDHHRAELPELFVAMLEDAKLTNNSRFRVEHALGHDIGFSYTPGRGWVNIFVRRRLAKDLRDVHTGPYERHGFNVDEQRWSYAKAPDNARVVRALLKQPT
jgi:hypothetical protein